MTAMVQQGCVRPRVIRGLAGASARSTCSRVRGHEDAASSRPWVRRGRGCGVATRGIRIIRGNPGGADRHTLARGIFSLDSRPGFPSPPRGDVAFTPSRLHASTPPASSSPPGVPGAPIQALLALLGPRLALDLRATGFDSLS
jgi:hypothetical protein